MKKLISFALSLMFMSVLSFAQDTTARSIRTTTHHVRKSTRHKAKSVGRSIDTGAKKTGNFVKKVATGLASDVTTSKDKSMHGPHDEKVFNGPRGGKYYVNKAGKKIYLKRDKAK